MNLLDDFEPMQPPADGLQHIQKKARKRAVLRRLGTGIAGGAVPLFSFFLFITVITWSFDLGASVTDSGPATSSPATSGVETGCGGGTGSLNICPNADGLPGSSVAPSILGATIWLALLISIIAVIVIIVVSVTSAYRSPTPAVRQPRWVRRTFVVLTGIPVLLLVLTFFGF